MAAISLSAVRYIAAVLFFFQIFLCYASSKEVLSQSSSTKLTPPTNAQLRALLRQVEQQLREHRRQKSNLIPDEPEIVDPMWLGEQNAKRARDDDYGHLRFGRTAPDDYGHMRFGK